MVSVVVDVRPWLGESDDGRKLAFDSLDQFVESFAQNNSYENVELLLVGAEVDCARFDERFEAVECAADAGLYERLNAGAAKANGDYVLFLDAGCFFDTPEPLEQLVGLCSLDGVGVSAPKTLYRGGRNKAYGVAVTSERIMPLYRGYEDDFPGYQCNLRALQNVSACGVQGLTVSRELFEAIGGFD